MTAMRAARLLVASFALLAIAPACRATAAVEPVESGGESATTAAAADATRVIDDFSDAKAWRAEGTDDVRAELVARDGASCLAYDLAGTAGYATLRRDLAISFPPNFEMTLKLRGDAGRNQFQLKFGDASGDNVWWWRRLAYDWPRDWTVQAMPASEVDFAWGPTKDKQLRDTARVEITIAAGDAGGAGEVCFDELALRPVSGDVVRDVAKETHGDAVLRARVAAAPRGAFPRGVSGEQQYWTILGVDGGGGQALFSEDGAIETVAGGWSLEPFLLDGKQVLTWAEAKTSHALRDDYLPMPRVTRVHGDLELTVDAFAAGKPGRSDVFATYVVANRGTTLRKVTLLLAVRPWQVNPPSQFLGTPGGAAHVGEIVWRDGTAIIDKRVGVYAATPPDGALGAKSTASFPQWLQQKPRARDTTVVDPGGGASLALAWRLALPPGATRSIALQLPLAGDPARQPAIAEGWAAQAEATAAAWRGRLDRVAITLPPSRKAIADTVRTALAHILIEREGPALRPGTRAYSRTWIRDGAMMSETLMRLGEVDTARAFTDWYAGKLFRSGKVPCCVDRRGSDPVPENDSAGEFVHLVAELHRYDGDRDGLRARWPAVQRAMTYLESLRQRERNDANRTPDRRARYGLLPPSISHEGYSAKPAYSYWDDFWGLAGYRGGVAIAQALGETQALARYSAQRDEFRDDLVASVKASTAQFRIRYVPGAADLGDFDPTSTTIALAQGGAQDDLPEDLVRATFERYWRESQQRARGERAWDVYTPYEWRNVGAFVRLNAPERAQRMLEFFMADRRPAAWNQWAEVVSHAWREPRFLGDMPHGWVASDYLYAVLDLFAYERHRDQALVLAGGIGDDWLREGPVSIAGLRTPWGTLGYTLAGDGACRELRIDAGRVPPGGLVVRAEKAVTARLAGDPGQLLAIRNGEVTVASRPATLLLADHRGACDGRG